MGRFKTVIVVPAYNEEKTILNVLNDLKNYSEIILVDDNSTDKTSELAGGTDVIIIKNSKNLGYEKSIEIGLYKAIELN